MKGTFQSQLAGWATGIHACWGALGDSVEHASELSQLKD